MAVEIRLPSTISSRFLLWTVTRVARARISTPTPKAFTASEYLDSSVLTTEIPFRADFRFKFSFFLAYVSFPEPMSSPIPFLSTGHRFYLPWYSALLYWSRPPQLSHPRHLKLLTLKNWVLRLTWHRGQTLFVVRLDRPKLQ